MKNFFGLAIVFALVLGFTNSAYAAGPFRNIKPVRLTPTISSHDTVNAAPFRSIKPVRK